MAFVEVARRRPSFWVPKFRLPLEDEIMSTMFDRGVELERFLGKHGSPIYYKSTGGLYWKVFTDFAPRFTVNGEQSSSSRQKTIFCKVKTQSPNILAALSSNLFWWWYTVTSNLRDLNPSDIDSFRVPESALSDASLADLGRLLVADLRKNSVTMTREQRTTGTTKVQSFRVRLSKGLLNQIDGNLLAHYGLKATHVDLISSYDLAWRMGLFTEDDGDED